MGKLTTEDRAILKALSDRALDLYDLADKVGRSAAGTFALCGRLANQGLLDWMYADDPISLSPAGREALSKAKEGKE